jgi:hypothetical protein
MDLIAHNWSYYGRNGRQYPSPDEAYCLGICAGAFSAAAVSSSSSLSELVNIASETVIIAFRTALHSSSIKNDTVGNNEEHGRSWSVIIPGEEKEVQEKLDRWGKSEVSLCYWLRY